jgi:6-pyruvoyl-tetrahydropterin synthase
VEGLTDEEGVLIEYADLDSIVLPVLRLADHYSLNSVDKRCSTLEARHLAMNPTVERLAEWLGARLAGLVSSSKADGRKMRLVRVSVQEDSRSGADWTPSDPR